MDATKLAQLYGALRVLVPACIAAAAGLGWLTPNNASELASALATAAPAVITLGAVIWSIVSHSKRATIAATAAMPEVKAVVAAPAVADGPTFAANPKVITPAQAAGQIATNHLGMG